MTVKRPTISIIGTAGLPARYGGFETLAHYLTDRLRNDCNFVVFCPGVGVADKVLEYNGAKLVYLPFKANGPQGILYDIVSIIISVVKYDRLLILGSGGSIVLPFLFPFKRKIALNFGGLEWKRDKWGYLTRAYLKISERLGVLFSGKLVADNQYFVDYVASEYGCNSYLIEYGGDHCIVPMCIDDNLVVRYPFLNTRYYLSVSRAQEDNNIHMLLEAFDGLAGHTLVVISNWSSSQYGRDLKLKYAGVPNLILLDAIYDLDVLNAIRSSCYVYLHSHSFCGTAPSLVEVMSLGKPVISYGAPTNLETTERQALYFVDVTSLRGLLAVTDSITLTAIGESMRDIATRRYTWDVIAEKYYTNIFS